eukprot:EG_transcript_57095
MATVDLWYRSDLCFAAGADSLGGPPDRPPAAQPSPSPQLPFLPAGHPFAPPPGAPAFPLARLRPVQLSHAQGPVLGAGSLPGLPVPVVGSPATYLPNARQSRQ